MIYLTTRQRLLIWIISIIVAITVLALPVATHIYSPKLEFMIPVDPATNFLLSTAIVIALLSPSIAEYLNLRYTKRVSRDITVFLRHVTSGVSSGLTLTKAIEESSKTVKGPVGEKFREALTKFALGEDFDKAILDAGCKLGTPEARQISQIIVSSYASGARMPEILSAAETFYRMITSYKEERTSKIKPYLFVYYLSIAIFLMVSYFTLNNFIVPISKQSTWSIVQFPMSTEYFKAIFFQLAIIECVVAGLMGGKVSEGKLSAGLIHAVILLVITILFYFFLIF